MVLSPKPHSRYARSLNDEVSYHYTRSDGLASLSDHVKQLGTSFSSSRIFEPIMNDPAHEGSRSERNVRNHATVPRAEVRSRVEKI